MEVYLFGIPIAKVESPQNPLSQIFLPWYFLQSENSSSHSTDEQYLPLILPTVANSQEAFSDHF